MSYIINEIFIKNFKSIDEAYLKDLNGSLTVLDGPNGFGKTSIFDAIELVLTGSIRRIREIKISNGTRGFKDHLIAMNQSEPVIIKLELLEKSSMSRIIIARKIEVAELNNIQKKPSEFISSLHNLSNMSDYLNDKNKVKDDFDLKFKTLRESFKFFNYIEQENSSHFFKEQEDVRMEEISKLFNIEKESAELKKLIKIRDKLRPYLRDQKVELKKLKEQLSLDGYNKNKTEEVGYQQILPESVHKNEPWDYEVISNFTLEKKNKFHSRIDNFKYLLDNFPQFKAVLINENIRALIKKSDRIKNLLVTGKLSIKKEEIVKEYDLKLKLLKLSNILSQHLFLEKDLDFELIYKYFEVSIQKEDLIDRINSIKELEKSNNQVSNSMATLMSVREKLLSNFKTISGEKENKCPMCGHTHVSYNDLIEEINVHTFALKEEMDSSSKVIVKVMNDLDENVFNSLIFQIDRFVDSLISNENYKVFAHNIESKMNIEKALDFFSKIGIDLEPFLYQDTSDFSNLEARTKELQNILEQKIKKNILFDLDRYNIAKDIFENTLENNEELIELIDTSLFENKKNYLNNQYLLHMDKISNEYINQKNKIEKIEDYISSIDNSIQIYGNELRIYNASMVKEIEIPFYLFSGKIIQNYHRGIGVFIKEDSSRANVESRLIRFVPHNETEHDVVHSFSSGQLSATVIAFTLAINKVFSSNNLNTILIDDPVQTMDDINMASFIELLRNDFGENQIILSTHSNSISLYMRYKFSKYGYKTKNINVKEELG